jgi:hypothetical protein
MNDAPVGIVLLLIGIVLLVAGFERWLRRRSHGLQRGAQDL